MIYIQYWMMWMSGGIVNLLFLIRLFERKKALKNTILIYNGVLSVFVTAKCYCIAYKPDTAVYIYSILIFVFYLIFALTFFKGSFMQKLMASILIYIISFIAEILTVSLLSTFFNIDMENMLDPPTFYFLYPNSGQRYRVPGLQYRKRDF